MDEEPPLPFQIQLLKVKSMPDPLIKLSPFERSNRRQWDEEPRGQCAVSVGY